MCMKNVYKYVYIYIYIINKYLFKNTYTYIHTYIGSPSSPRVEKSDTLDTENSDPEFFNPFKVVLVTGGKHNLNMCICLCKYTYVYVYKYIHIYVYMDTENSDPE
jgi:hypothetical protein